MIRFASTLFARKPAHTGPADVRDTGIGTPLHAAHVPVRMLPDTFRFSSPGAHEEVQVSVGACGASLSVRNAIAIALAAPPAQRRKQSVSDVFRHANQRRIKFEMDGPDTLPGRPPAIWKISVVVEDGRLVKAEIFDRSLSRKLQSAKYWASFAASPELPTAGAGVMASRRPLPGAGVVDRPLTTAAPSRRRVVVEPGLGWLTRETDHATCIVQDARQLTRARRQFREIFNQAGKSCLFLNDMDSLGRFEYRGSPHDAGENTGHGSAGNTDSDGEFRQILRKGGVLLINVANFSPGQLAAFHTLMEEGCWKTATGDDIHVPRDEKGELAIRIVGLSDVATLQKNVMSGAWHSRANKLHRMDKHDFSDAYADPELHDPLHAYPDDPEIVDMRGDPNWRQAFEGGIDINEQQRWENIVPSIDLSAGRPLVLRNLPTGPDGRPDPYLMDQIREATSGGVGAPGRAIRLEPGLPEWEISKLTSNKSKIIDDSEGWQTWSELQATQRDLQKEMADPQVPVCTVNASNLAETVDKYYGESQGFPIRRQGILARLGSSPDVTPLVHITASMQAYQWDRLMQHETEFYAVASPHVNVPERYKPHVFSLSDNYCAPVAASTDTVPVTILTSSDPGVLQELDDKKASRLYVVPGMHRNALLFSMEPDKQAEAARADISASLQGQGTEKSPASGPAVPAVKFMQRQLLADLRNGQKVILQGLEDNDELADELATLLHPPHYIEFNGQRLHFGPGGGLSGQLVIVSKDPGLAQKHPLTAAREEVCRGHEWSTLATKKLRQVFPHWETGQVETRLECLLQFYQTLRLQGLLPADTSPDQPVSYSQVEKLFRLFDAVPSNPDTEEGQFQARIASSLLKDNLAAGRGEYEKAKVLLKLHFPLETSLMRGSSVDEDGLRIMFEGVAGTGQGGVFHPADVRENAWEFLNLFSPAVMRQLIGDEIDELEADEKNTREINRQIADKVLLLVLEQADRMSLQLSLPLRNMLDRCRQRGERSGIAELSLERHVRPVKLEQNARNTRKVELAMQISKGVVLVGRPGTGKSYWMQANAGEGAVIGPADVGTPRHAEMMESYARKPGAKPMLKFDEFNLPPVGTHDTLTGLFENDTLLANNTLYTDLKNHAVLAAENASTEAGRKRHPIEDNHLVTVQFKSKRRETLNSDFVAPLLGHALKQPAFSHAAAWEEKLAAQMLDIHTALENAFPATNLSGRHLQEFLTQLLALVQKDPSLGEEEIRPWLAQLALTVYADHLPEDFRPVVRSWLLATLGLPADKELPSPALADLANSGLAATPGTQDCANSIKWFLEKRRRQDSFSHLNSAVDGDGLQSKPLGQIGLLVEGPAARGKDAVVGTMLKGVKHIRLNPNPDNLDATLESIEKARREGAILWVSELNFLPPEILDSVIGPLMSGDIKAAPGFGVIATINPSSTDDFIGAKPLSTAMESRFLKKIVADYTPAEQETIGRSIVRNLCQPGRQNVVSQYMGDEKLERVFARVRDLRRRLAAYPPSRQPKVRELRDTLIMLHNNQRSMTADQACDINFSYYETLAAPGGAKFLNVSAAAPRDEKALLGKQLQLALQLDHSRLPFLPALYPDEALDYDAPVGYDAAAHRLHFDPSRSIEELGSAMLGLLRDGLAGAAAPVYSRMPGRATAARTDPAADPGSGVFTAPVKGNIGHAHNTSQQVILLTRRRQNLQHQVQSTFKVLAVPATAAELTPDTPRIRMDHLQTVPGSNGRRRLYLMNRPHTRPVMVGQTSLRDEHGAWYVEVAADQETISNVEYSLVAQQEEAQATMPASFYSAVDVGRLRYADELHEIRSVHDADAPGRTVHALLRLFADSRYFEYSRADAPELSTTRNDAERIQRFLENGKGVCDEIAHGFAALLEQEFQIPTRLCGGFVIKPNGRIPRAPHLWVEYGDWQGNWHEVDPTAHVSNLTPASPLQRSDSDTSVRSLPIQQQSEQGLQRQKQRHIDSGRIQPFGMKTVTSKMKVSDQILKHFSATKVVGPDWNVKKENESHNAFQIGEIDMSRFFWGIPEHYRSPSSRTREYPRDVYIENLPEVSNRTEYTRFLVTMAPVLQALIETGTKIYIHDHNGKPSLLENALEIQNAYRQEAGREEDVSTRLITSASRNLLAGMLAHFAGATLKSAGISAEQNPQGAKNCLLDQYDVLMKTYDPECSILPLEFSLEKSTLLIDRKDIDTYRIDKALASNDSKILLLLILPLDKLITPASHAYLFNKLATVVAIDEARHIDPEDYFAELSILALAIQSDELIEQRPQLISHLQTLAGRNIDLDGLDSSKKPNAEDLKHFFVSVIGILEPGNDSAQEHERIAGVLTRVLSHLPDDLLQLKNKTSQKVDPETALLRPEVDTALDQSTVSVNLKRQLNAEFDRLIPYLSESEAKPDASADAASIWTENKPVRGKAPKVRPV